MSGPQIDLDLWLDKTLMDRQKQLKAQFIELFEEVGNSISNEELGKVHPASKGKKISKGNDLLGYPYVVLDLIRDFNQDKGMNIRVLNWFGHGCFLLFFLGKEIQIPVEPLIFDYGFEFGLTDDPWDFGKIIGMKNTTKDLAELLNHRNRFQIWIKKMDVFYEKNDMTIEIQKEIKYLIHLVLNSTLK